MGGPVGGAPIPFFQFPPKREPDMKFQCSPLPQIHVQRCGDGSNDQMEPRILPFIHESANVSIIPKAELRIDFQVKDLYRGELAVS